MWLRLTLCEMVSYTTCFVIFAMQQALFAQQLKKIETEEILSIGGRESEDLYQWTGVATDDSGFVFVSDALDYSIKKFDREGRLVNRVGRKGRGPGEFTGPRVLRYHDGFLYTTDQSNPGVQIFACGSLTYVDHIPFGRAIADFRVLSGNEIVIAAPQFHPSEVNYLLVVNMEGVPQDSIAVARAEQPFMLDMVSFDYHGRENLYIVFTWKDRILKLNPRAQSPIWQKSLVGGITAEFRNVADFRVPTHVVYKDIAVDTLGNVFILGGYYAEHRSRDIYVLNSDGHHVTTFSLEEASHAIHLDRRNHLYVRGGQGTILKKLALHYLYH